MEEISELIRIVLSHTRKNLPLLDLKAQEDNDNKELNLFLGVKSGEYDSDAVASKGIYGEKEVGFKFRMLKSRLNRKLLNHLFFVDFGLSKAHKSVSFYQECLDYLHFSKMLLKLGEVKLATKFLYKTVDLAKECEYYGILNECLLALRDIYATTYRPKLFQATQQEIAENKKLLDKEEEAGAIFYECKLQLNSSLTNRKKDLKPFHKGLQKLKKLADDTGSVNIFIQYVKLTIWLLEQEGQFEKVLAFIEELENNFRKGKLNMARFDVSLLRISKLYSFLKLKRHSEGLALAGNYLKETDKETPVWFAFMENYALFAIRLKEYSVAVSCISEALKNTAFNDLPEEAKEKWHVYAAYLYFLTADKSLAKKVDYDGLLKEVPEFQKDKAGINLALLNLQFLASMDGDLDHLHKILQAMDDYVNKYLNNTFSKRSKVFYKLIYKIASHNRDFDTVLKKSKYLAEKLFESEIEGDIYADMEIVPYEHLWDQTLKRLSVLRYQFSLK